MQKNTTGERISHLVLKGQHHPDSKITHKELQENKTAEQYL